MSKKPRWAKNEAENLVLLSFKKYHNKLKDGKISYFC
jgi:hypothetical protein